MKKAILKVMAKVGKKMAIKACGAASYFGYHQPVEPESVRKAAEERRQAKLAKKMAKKNVNVHTKNNLFIILWIFAIIRRNAFL